MEANLVEANLTRAAVDDANLLGAHLSGATLAGAKLRGANLTQADLSRADLSGSSLLRAILVESNFENSDLTGCEVYGISAWNLKANEGTKQSGLVITRLDEPTITVGDLEVAQFIYLLLNNKKVRQVIDTVTSKVVLILGRFTPERKGVLDAIWEELRQRNYTPVLFDFEKPASRDLTETITTLALMARFIIADITDSQSIPQELQAIVPNLPSVAIQPLIEGSSTEYIMFEHFARYPWVLATHRYHDLDDLLASVKEKVIAPAEKKVAGLRQK